MECYTGVNNCKGKIRVGAQGTHAEDVSSVVQFGITFPDGSNDAYAFQAPLDERPVNVFPHESMHPHKGPVRNL